MAMSENMIKGKWREIKSDIQKTWGKITDAELDKTKGEMKAVGSLIQQKYGVAKENYNQKLAEIYKKFEEKKDKPSESMKKDS